MREIMFRGLELMTGEWVYGSHLKTGTGLEYIVPQNLIANLLPQYAVDKDTVGQYTGLVDKDGVKVHVGDIVEHINGIRAKINYVPEHGAFLAHYVENGNAKYDYLDRINQCKIIGNIYENAELVEA